MFCSKTNIQRVEKVQYKTLQVVYNNYMATYYELLALDNKLQIHQRHLQFLAIEMYESENKHNPSLMWKRYNEKKYPIFNMKGDFPLYSKHKHSAIWNKLINFQRKCFVEQPTNKVKRK